MTKAYAPQSSSTGTVRHKPSTLAESGSGSLLGSSSSSGAAAYLYIDLLREKLQSCVCHVVINLSAI